MMRPLLIVAAAAAWLLAAASTHAQVTLSLESGGPDVAQLYVGQTATVDVRLDGLQPGWQLDALAASVVYDDALLGPPSITAGPIVPDPPDSPWDFLTMALPGYAEASFLTFGMDPAAHVTSDGVFFSFDVTPAEVGSGAFAIDFTDATQFNPADPFDPIHLWVDAGPPLAFTVVPEPGSAALLAAAVLLLGTWRRPTGRRRNGRR